MMVNHVASDPVPAVVGIAIIFGSGVVISLPMKSAIVLSGSAASNAIAFMESKGLPPPIPIRKSHSSCL